MMGDAESADSGPQDDWEMVKPRKVVDPDREFRIVDINWHDLPSYSDIEVDHDE